MAYHADAGAMLLRVTIWTTVREPNDFPKFLIRFSLTSTYIPSLLSHSRTVTPIVSPPLCSLRSSLPSRSASLLNFLLLYHLLTYSSRYIIFSSVFAPASFFFTWRLSAPPVLASPLISSLFTALCLGLLSSPVVYINHTTSLISTRHRLSFLHGLILSNLVS